MSSPDCSHQYKDLRPRYEKLTKKISSLLEEIFYKENIKAVIESRTKDIKSYEEKVSRPGKSYLDPLKEVTDISGIRVILYSTRDVDRVAALIKSEFCVDEKNSIDKSSQLDPDRFGYLSQHYIVQISESRKDLVEWSDVSSLLAEIQVRTVLQHAWASLEHFLVYKNKEDAPKALRRRLFRLSALFELADEELDSLITERLNKVVQYKNDVSEGRINIDLNIDSFKAYMQDSDEPKYWRQYLRNHVQVSIPETDWNDMPRCVKFAKFFGLNSIDKVNDILRNAHGWGEKFLAKYYERYFAENGTTPDKVYVVSAGPVIMLLVAANLSKISAQTMKKDFGWGKPELLFDAAKESR